MIPKLIILEKGKYRVIEVLSISESLYSLKNNDERDNTNAIHKVLLQSSQDNKVAYFVDPINFGAGSKIFLREDMDSPLIRTHSYVLMEKKKYKINASLAERLLLASFEKGK